VLLLFADMPLIEAFPLTIAVLGKKTSMIIKEKIISSFFSFCQAINFKQGAQAFASPSFF
jgi:hypothetical protein